MTKYPTKLVFIKTDIFFAKTDNITPGNEVNDTLGNFLNDILKKEIYEKIKEKYKIVIYGFEEIEENMSFLFYYFNFSYLDTFLYIVFVDKN